MKISKFAHLLELINPKKGELILDALMRASIISASAKVFAYIKNIAIAVLLGFSVQTDAFFMALGLMGIFLIFVEVFDSLGIPNLVRAKKEGEGSFLELSRVMLTFTAALAIVTAVVSFISIPLLSKIAVGFSGEKVGYLKTYILALIPFVFFSFFFHHFGAILRSRRLFAPFFIGELIFSFFSALFIAGGIHFYKDGIVLPLSLSAAQLIATIYMAARSKKYIHFSISINPQARNMLGQFLSLTALQGVFHLFILADRAFASMLPTKSITALSYGFMIAAIPKGLIRSDNILITPLSEAEGGLTKLRFYASKLALIGVVFLVILIVFADILIRVFFGYGAFSNLDHALTVEAARYYALVVPFLFLWPVFYRVLQIREKLKALVFIALFSVMLNAMANYIFIVVFEMGLKGIALGTFLSYAMLTLSSYVYIVKTSKGSA